MQAKHGDRFRLHLTLDRPPKNWGGYSGFVTEEMLSETMPPAGEKIVVRFRV
jgi:hypothetical protein